MPQELKKKFIEKSGEVGKVRAELMILELELEQLHDQIRMESSSDSFEQVKKEIISDNSKPSIATGDHHKEDDTVYEKAAKQEEQKETEEKAPRSPDEFSDPKFSLTEGAPDDLPSSSRAVTIDEAIEWMEQMVDDSKKEWSEGDTRLGILRYLGYSEDEIDKIRNGGDEADEDSEESAEEESSESEELETKAPAVPSPPPPPAPPKPPSKPEAPAPAETKKEEKTEDEPKVEAPKKESPKNDESLKVELPEGVVRPEGSPECFGNKDVFDPESKKCLTCIYDFECKEAIEAAE